MGWYSSPLQTQPALFPTSEAELTSTAHHLSAESLSRPACALKLAAQHLKQPGLISLGGGLPSATNFPISSLSMHIPVPEAGFSEAATSAKGQTVRMGK